MIECIMLDSFRFWLCVYPISKQIKSLLIFDSIWTRKRYKKENNNNTCTIYVELNNTDINDQPIPFHILIYTFLILYCLNINKVNQLISSAILVNAQSHKLLKRMILKPLMHLPNMTTLDHKILKLDNHVTKNSSEIASTTMKITI